MPLQLKQVEVLGDEYDVFRTWPRAMAHVCDHLLTRPETWMWSLYLDCYRTYLADDQAETRFKLGCQVWQSPEKGQGLYEGYVKEIERSLTESTTLGWFYGRDFVPPDNPSGRHVRYSGIGLSGAMVGWTPGHVNTCYFPAEGRSDVANYDEHARKRNPLPREPEQPQGLVRIPPDSLPMRYRIFIDEFKAVRFWYANAYRKEPRHVSPAQQWKALANAPSEATWSKHWKSFRAASAEGVDKEQTCRT